jgi:hypothetical protein
MRTTAFIRRATATGAALALAIAATMIAAATSPKFFNDDPVWTDPATQDATGIKSLEVGLFSDLAYNIIKGSTVTEFVRARNLNTVDEVPDSSWFTNRGRREPLTAADVATGPDTTPGPARGNWTIRSSKSDGVTPGFTITDATGERWFLKFDPPGYRGMSTGTEVTVTKLMWALGYNVPENHIAYLRPEQLTIGSEAQFTPAGGKRRPMRMSDLDDLLERADREADGSYRVVASRAVAGTPIGRIRFSGTRPDDPNDVVPHEHRRELRGYGTFAAWLNHVDAKAINSLDTLITENGKSFVRHHLIDFGSALGSGGVAPADYWAGDEYLVQPGHVGKQIIGFGFVSPKWQSAPFYESPSIGRLRSDNTSFNPEQWKPRVPNRAFLNARADDKFWAARKLAALEPDMLRAAVQAGEFGDQKSEEFLLSALLQRRDAIARTYLTALNPISDPKLDNAGELTFVNAAMEADVAKAPSGYRAIWSTFDNATGTSERIGETSNRGAALRAPDGLPNSNGTFIKVELSATGGPTPAWERAVDAYFRRIDGSWKLIGFERMP